MRISLLLVLVILTNVSWSQNLETRIKNVENGLAFPKIVSLGKKTSKGNILKRLKRNKINGASVAVIHQGKLAWAKTYGITEAGSTNPVTTTTLFQAASIGKVITALAVLKLVAEGKLDLDENVNDKLKRWKIKENKHTESTKVTLRHLLSHSAGLTDGYGFLGYDPKDQIPTLLQILNNASPAKTKKSLAIKSTPGKVERYSGAGYLIIQLLIEDVSQLSFADYVQQRIFTPLQMTNTTYDNQPDKNQGKSIAAGHLSNGKSLKNKRYNIYPEKAAAGPWTTAEDLAKLVVAIQGASKNQADPILPQALITKFLSPQINNKGLGVNLKGVDKPQAFWHAGQNLGYTALLYGLIDQGEGTVVLLNSDGGERFMQEFVSSVANEYNWPVMKSYESLKIAPSLQSLLVGKYQSTNPSQSIYINQKKGTLFIKPANSRKAFQLYKIGENHYTLKDSQDYFKLKFTFENDKVTSMTYAESIGKVLELKKVE